MSSKVNSEVSENLGTVHELLAFGDRHRLRKIVSYQKANSQQRFRRWKGACDPEVETQSSAESSYGPMLRHRIVGFTFDVFRLS